MTFNEKFICVEFLFFLLIIFALIFSEKSKSSTNNIAEAYGEHYEDNKSLIDAEGWLRVCKLTSVKMGIYLYENENNFDSKVEALPDMFISYVRPKSLSTK